MDDLIAEQTASNSQPQGAPEIPIEKKDNLAPQSRSQLSRRKKIVLGIATFWPIFYIGTAVLGFFILTSLLPEPDYSLDFPGLGQGIVIAFFSLPFAILLIPTVILSLAITIIYLLSVFKNRRIYKSEKLFWAVVFFHGFFYSRIYWLLGDIIWVSKDLSNLGANINLGIFLVIPYILMSIYWYRYIWEGTRLNQLIKRRYWYVYALIVIYVLVYLVPLEISMAPEVFKVFKVVEMKRRQLGAFENAKMFNVYTLSTNGWLENDGPRIYTKGAGVEVEYYHSFSSLHDEYRTIHMVEFISPKTDLKCNNNTYSQLDKIAPEYRLVSEKQWLTNCEELLVSGEKAISSGYDQRVKPAYATYDFYNQKYYLIVFDKGNTRILLYYEHLLEEFLVKDEYFAWSKNRLIRAAENLRLINEKDFGL